MEQQISTKQIDFKGFEIDAYQDILTNDAQVFLLELHEKFNQRSSEIRCV
jgi:malate synthase